MGESGPGWYPDPAGGGGQRYWDGQQWTTHVHIPASAPLREPRSVSLAMVLLIPYSVVFGGLGAIFALISEWKALLGVVMLAVLVGAPIALVLLTTRKVKQARREHVARRAYEAELVARFDAAAHAESVDLAPFGPTPDAEQMRQQAWQPDEVPAVRPSSPAPWHVVTQYPTRQFRSHTATRPSTQNIDSQELR